MRRHKVSCLPVTRNGSLVGIVTERDFIVVAAKLLEEELRRP
jgi:CBS domain-containing protein